MTNSDELVERFEQAINERLEWDGGQSDVSVQWSDARALLDTILSLKSEIEALREAGRALIADVRRRYPGEELRCEYMRALDAALSGSPEG